MVGASPPKREEAKIEEEMEEEAGPVAPRPHRVAASPLRGATAVSGSPGQRHLLLPGGWVTDYGDGISVPDRRGYALGELERP